MQCIDQWSNLSEMISNLIAKYANVLDIDSMQEDEPNSNIKNEEHNEKNPSKVLN